MKKLALIYWPKGGSVESVSKLIEKNIKNFNVSLHCVADIGVSTLKDFDAYIFGGSTVGADHWSNDATDNDWGLFFAELEKHGQLLSGKKGAIFGLGNQLLYPDQFVDGMMYMKKKLVKAGLTIVGETSTEGYDYNESKAEVDGKFVGLALDEDSQGEYTRGRVDGWLSVICDELNQ